MSDETRKIGPGVPPLRPPNPNKGKRKKGEKGAYNRAHRGREWLEEEEVRQLRAAAAKLGRHGHRDSTMILMGYRHGLHVTELVNLSWDIVNMNQHEIFIRRVKGSKSTMHTMQRDEMTALRKLGPNRSGLVFRSERGKGPVSERRSMRSSPAPGRKPAWASRSTHTCLGMPAGTTWATKTRPFPRASSRSGSAMSRSSTPCSTPI